MTFASLRRSALLMVIATSGAACGRANAPRHYTVEMHKLAYRPGTLEVSVGDTITWINRDIVPHTVTAQEAGWDSGQLLEGGEFHLVVGEGDGGTYACTYHPTMRGTLTVRSREH
jgi:plastocyanin